jgi:thioredoxin 1
MTKVLPQWDGVVTQVDSHNFEDEVINADKPVLVDFWSPACVPCRNLIPTVEAFAKKYKDSVKVVKVNVEENSALACKYAIGSIPNILLFKGKEVKGQIIGSFRGPKLEKLIL